MDLKTKSKIGSAKGPVADSCEHSNEPSGFVKGGEFFDRLLGS